MIRRFPDPTLPEHDTFYRANKMSMPLAEAVRRYDTFEEFEKHYPDEFLNDGNEIGFYLEQLLTKYNKKAAAVSEAAGRATAYVGNIVNGHKKNPSRDTLIAICLAIGMTFDEVQYLLKYAGQAPLYVRRKRDVIIWFGFVKGKTLEEVDDKLYERGFKTLVPYE